MKEVDNLERSLYCACWGNVGAVVHDYQGGGVI